MLDLINEQKVFISKADKGGATLILDYHTVEDDIIATLSDPNKFAKLETNIG